MPQERDVPYDYSKNPDIDISGFARWVHEQQPDTLHPVITKRQQEAERITQHLPEVNSLTEEYPELIPPLADQGLILTSYDDFDGMRVEIPPEEYLEGWKLSRDFNLKLANHPSRIAAMRELEQQGFQPPGKLHGILDKAAPSGRILQLSDLGQNGDLKRYNKEPPIASQLKLLKNKSKEEIARMQRSREAQQEVDVFVEAQIANPQTHRTELLATGPFSFVGKRVRSFIGLGAMPDINGSVLMLETAAKMHMLSELPEVGFFSDPKRQAELAKSTLEKLRADDPLLTGRSYEEIQYILKSWKSCIVGVLEVGEIKALKRAAELAKVGVESFRVYGHTQGGDVIKTTRALRKEYPNAEIFSSQVTNVDTAIACEAVGADAIIIGIGSGGRCTTADLSQLVPSNALLSWHLRGDLGIPVIGEGGAVDEPVIAALVGMSGVNGSGSIGGGTFESPGGMYYLTRDGKKFVKPYGGEASPRTKEISGRAYATGLPYFPEGEQGFKELTPLEESMTQKMIYHWQRVILGGVVLGADAGPYLIQRMQERGDALWEKSPTTQDLQRAH
jgi:hypothetical protein